MISNLPTAVDVDMLASPVRTPPMQQELSRDNIAMAIASLNTTGLMGEVEAKLNLFANIDSL